MKRLLCLLLLVALSGLGAAAARAPGDAGDPNERLVAVDAATRFLELLDGGQIGGTWELIGGTARRLTSRPVWAATLSGLRASTGNLQSRTLIDVTFSKRNGGSPPGHYFAVRFDSRFDKMRVEERVVLNLEQGQWRIEGYFLAPHARAKR